MKLKNTSIDGCFLINNFYMSDERGSFTKIFQESKFESQNLNFDFVEDFYSVSKKNVLRGFHFQTPPADHSKLVFCLSGKILDVVIDLRKNSKTYGKCESFILSHESNLSVYLTQGLGHAFLTLTDQAIVYYKVTSEHSPQNDHGILWSSIEFTWPIDSPILSDRDLGFPPLKDFKPPQWRL